MTRLGFGLNTAPKIMSKILSTVLSLDPTVAAGTDHYIDDILVNKSVVPVEVVRSHLLKFGLVTKEPVDLREARVLGLRVTISKKGICTWQRDSAVPTVESIRTKRDLFSACGKLIGHYPVAGWLRVACSYMKRCAADGKWDDAIAKEVLHMLDETLNRVTRHDPVQGKWSVNRYECCKVWCDASSIAIGVCIEMEGSIVEDASWLRKIDDSMHINVAELEAVLKGLNLAIKWGVKQATIVTDSLSVYNWVNSIITESHRPKVSGFSEMIVKRRLGVIAQLVEEYGITLQMSLVKSADNRSDVLTRVNKKWLKPLVSCVGAAAKEVSSIDEEIYNMHQVHHLGVDKMSYLANQRFGDRASKDVIERVVKECQICKQIDPSPVRWERGNLEVEKVWHRLAVDITHVGRIPYLTILDCGPSRFAIWLKLRDETANSVIAQLVRIFEERGPPQELFSDNGPCFKSAQLSSILKTWNVNHLLSCAYRPSGNGIVERNHRTIKRMAARSGNEVNRMVFWYNNTPNRRVLEVDGTNRHISEIRLADCNGEDMGSDRVSSDDAVEVEFDFDNLNICKNDNSSVDSDTESDSDHDSENTAVGNTRPIRDRRPPERYGEFYEH
ncbi:uncharacterized protein [Watersipora subatra]|uniref:uncharacterized protein n=1 Tax=Watersipora subatra TaxID=2589382 RepID=UPI00355C2F40